MTASLGVIGTGQRLTGELAGRSRGASEWIFKERAVGRELASLREGQERLILLRPQTTRWGDVLLFVGAEAQTR